MKTCTHGVEPKKCHHWYCGRIDELEEALRHPTHQAESMARALGSEVAENARLRQQNRLIKATLVKLQDIIAITLAWETQGH